MAKWRLPAGAKHEGQAISMKIRRGGDIRTLEIDMRRMFRGLSEGPADAT
jgi:hypothetical protein